MPQTVTVRLDELVPVRSAPAPEPEPTPEPEPKPASQGIFQLSGPLASLFTPEIRQRIASVLAGHETPAPGPDASVAEIVEQARNAGLLRTVGSTAYGLTLGPLVELAQTLGETAPDIVRNLLEHPAETLRGGTSGVVEGVMTETSPLNLLLLAAGGRRLGRGTTTPARRPPGQGGPRTFRVPPGPEMPPNTQALQEGIREALEELRRPEAPREVSLPPSHEPVATASAAETLARAAAQGRLDPRIVEELNARLRTRATLRAASPRTATGVPPRSTPAGSPGFSGGAATTAGQQTITVPIEQLDRLLEKAPKGAKGAPGTASETGAARVVAGAPAEASIEASRAVSKAAKSAPTFKVRKAEQAVLDREREVRALKYKGGTPPPGMESILDRMYLEYRRTQDTLEKLRRSKGTDPRELQRFEQAARELGSRYSTAVKEAVRLSKATRPAGGSEAGLTSSELLTRAGLATGGGLLASSQGETPEERLELGLTGTVAGLITPEALRVLARTAGRGNRNLENLYFFNLLSSPVTVLKANAGALGGAVAAGLEKIRAGERAAGQAILRELFSDRTIQRYMQALRHPEIVGGELQKAGTRSGIVGLPTRLIAAADYAASRAMRAGGISREEAARYTLSGQPTSQGGKLLLAALNQYFWTRLLSPFPRVGVQTFERGIERSPTAFLRAKTPIERARAELGTAALAGGLAFGDDIPLEYTPIVAAATGPYMLPVLTGLVGRQAVEADTNPVSAIVTQLMQQSPLPSFINPANILAGAVPNIVRDIARARDPFERETRADPDLPLFARTLQSLTNQTKAKIPGLRETLPIRAVPVDTFGRPLVGRESALSRFIAPQPRERLKRKAEGPVMAELDRLGIKLEPPQPPSTVSTGRYREKEVPREIGMRAQQTRRAGLEDQLRRLINTENYKRLPDAAKRRVIQRFLDRFEQRAGRRTRSFLLREMRRNERE